MSEMLPEMFDAAAGELAQGMEDGAGAYAQFIEETAEKEEQCVGNEMSADADAAKAISAIGEKAGQDAGDVTDVADAAGSGVPGETAGGPDGTGVTAGGDGGGLTPDALVDSNGWAPQERDLEFLGQDPEQLQWLAERSAPMGMTPEEYQEFRGSMLDAARQDGIDPDSLDVRAQGSAANYYASDKKLFDVDQINQDPDAASRLREWFGDSTDYPAHHMFDSRYKLGLDSDPSDYDINISSTDMVDRARAIWDAQAAAGNPYDGSFLQGHEYVNKDVAADAFPALDQWKETWSSRLNRDVSWAVFHSGGPPNELLSDGSGLSVHFRDSDWIIHAPEKS
jgi:hypothetical protein